MCTVTRREEDIGKQRPLFCRPAVSETARPQHPTEIPKWKAECPCLWNGCERWSWRTSRRDARFTGGLKVARPKKTCRAGDSKWIAEGKASKDDLFIF